MKYAILDISDTEHMWQEVACFITYENKEKKFIEQRLIVVQLRIGRMHLLVNEFSISAECRVGDQESQDLQAAH